ncbi:hypothetical protein IWQ61_006889, partial [Dispira simplex]
DCELTLCNDQSNRKPLPLGLRLLFWTCPQNCQYECMQTITEKSKLRGGRIHQYFGKWPFYRFLGIQEPASTLFSLLNGYAHWSHWSVLRSTLHPGYYMRPWYLMYLAVNVNTWLWSTVFHMRDFGWTEKMDYFSAGFSVLFMLLVAVIRNLRLDWRKSPGAVKFVVGLHLMAFVAHVSYLSFWKFDYGYNMLANVAVGLLCNFMWVTWSWRHRSTHPMAWRPTLCVLLISAAMSLELFDFPPFLGILDAHSLWHASTIPIIFMFYNFILCDAEWDYKVLHLKK